MHTIESMAKTVPYNERLLHWIWEKRQLATSLLTADGRPVSIYNPGFINETDGPDFVNARIGIGKLTFYGDVEIHWSAGDWNAHGHDNDANYNRVILHAVFNEKNISAVSRADQTRVPTLCIKPFLRRSLQEFAEQYLLPKTLPCAGHIESVPRRSIETQFAKARKEYFEVKVDNLLQFYDPDRTISTAWQKLCIIGVFDALGISHNREPMKQLAAKLYSIAGNTKTPEELTQKAFTIAGIDPETGDGSDAWNRKGSRPHNHPRHRIAQGCELLRIIKKTPVLHWLRTDIRDSFNYCRQQMHYKPGLGSHRADVIFATVWLPSIYILADLLGKKTFTKMAYDTWINHKLKLPASITRTFEHAGMPAAVYRENPGAVFQQKAYCRPRSCQHCKVFKSIISS